MDELTSGLHFSELDARVNADSEIFCDSVILTPALKIQSVKVTVDLVPSDNSNSVPKLLLTMFENVNCLSSSTVPMIFVDSVKLVLESDV